MERREGVKRKQVLRVELAINRETRLFCWAAIKLVEIESMEAPVRTGSKSWGKIVLAEIMNGSRLEKMGISTSHGET